MNILYSRQARSALLEMPEDEKAVVLHGLKLIANGQDICFETVRNERWALEGCEGPYRAKWMCVARKRGGIRAIFSFKDNVLMLVQIVQYRDADPYGDGR